MTRLLLLAYPRRWRMRYGEEMADLLDATGIGPSIALDVIRAGLRERGRIIRAAVVGGDSMTFRPAWRHPVGWGLAAAALLVPTGAFVVFSVLTYQLGLTGMRTVMEPVNDWLAAWRPADLAIVVAPAVALVVAVAPLIRLELGRHDGQLEGAIAFRLRALNLVVATASLALGGMLVWHIVVESVLQVGP